MLINCHVFMFIFSFEGPNDYCMNLSLDFPADFWVRMYGIYQAEINIFTPSTCTRKTFRFVPQSASQINFVKTYSNYHAAMFVSYFLWRRSGKLMQFTLITKKNSFIRTPRLFYRRKLLNVKHFHHFCLLTEKQIKFYFQALAYILH